MISARAANRIRLLDPAGSVFAEYTQKAIQHKAVNLGQGFPTLGVAKFILENLKKTTMNNGLVHQYSRSQGHLPLVNSLASYFSPRLETTLEPTSDILVTVGATQAISSTISAFIDSGDECILIQPFYDSYPASVLLAGGKPVYSNLMPPSNGTSMSSEDWTLDLNDLESKITAKTKMIILNNPNNPVGKVYSKKELEEIAKIVEKHDLLVLADEVYETLVYDKQKMIKFASLPGMKYKTITVGSVGKMFGVTGWKIGWCIGAPDLIRSIWMVHQFTPFSVATPIQEAVHLSLEQAQTNGYFDETRHEYQRLRDLLQGYLEKADLPGYLPQGGYFIMADTSNINVDLKDGRGRDYDVCDYLTRAVGVTAIPPSAFYDSPDGKVIAERFARFAFCKQQDMIDQAGDLLKNK